MACTPSGRYYGKECKSTNRGWFIGLCAFVAFSTFALGRPNDTDFGPFSAVQERPHPAPTADAITNYLVFSPNLKAQMGAPLLSQIVTSSEKRIVGLGEDGLFVSNTGGANWKIT